jgi:hypothetical protein
MPYDQHLALLSRGSVSRERPLNPRPNCAEEVAELTGKWSPVTDAADCRALEDVPKSCPERNQKDRIIEALGSVGHIPKVHAEPLFRYYKYLRKHLRFPFLAHYPKPANYREEEEFRFTVLELLVPAKHLGDGFDGIFCKTRKDKYELNLPLIDLYLPENSFNFQLIDDYWYWFWNWR